MEEANLKIVSFNIRCDYQQDGTNDFCYRKPLIEEKIKKEGPDIIAFQEVLPHVALWLKNTFADYTVLGVGRSAIFEDEQVSILLRKDRFDVMDMETFWLSPTPDVPGSRFPGQSPCPRTCAHVFLRDLVSKRILSFYNVHLDHQAAEVRLHSLRLLLQTISDEKRFPESYRLLAGDFNATPDSAEIGLLDSWGRLDEATHGIGGTFHDFGREKAPTQIDYVFADKRFSVLSRLLWLDSRNDVFLSDHYPVEVIFRY